MKKKRLIILSIIISFFGTIIPFYVQNQMYLHAYHQLRNTSIRKNYVRKIKRVCKYNGFTLLHIYNNGHIENQSTFLVDDYAFELSNFNVCIYKKNKMYDLKNAYYCNIISIDEVRVFHSEHLRAIAREYLYSSNLDTSSYYKYGDLETPSMYR